MPLEGDQRDHEDMLARVETALAGPRLQDGSSDFDLNQDGADPSWKFRPAAVLVPIISAADGPKLVLTKRAAHLKHHPGQVSFPGGKVETSDNSVEDAALREAFEEIGLRRKHARLIGRLPCHKTVTGFEVHPVVAEISTDFASLGDPGEVEEVFQVPLEHVLNPANYFIEGRVWMGKPRRYFVVPYGPYYIWGATARMLRLLAETVGRDGHANHG
ncbi:CoA pyrophosphatase [Neptunicoccus cionae]|uniref:Coenzyme A pyrophosphatase n=1 Tax=Neptunicoccus cionae TaxID=2035344 RepID=A0A916VQF8_9RHOB|nr:CoA pyrophosphatase [Amylibacter cionae]GGA18010.1 coenzyme A pyrophosphatase [Amylibacter cionae]